MWGTLVGVLVGGAITLAVTLVTDIRRERTHRGQAQQEEQRRLRQAARLILEELHEIDLGIQEAVATRRFWASADSGRDLPTMTWNDYRATVADILPDAGSWRLTAVAYQSVNELNWVARRHSNLRGRVEDNEALLRSTFRAVHTAMDVLQKEIGPLGAFGYSGYVELSELEARVWGSVDDQRSLDDPS